MPFSVTPDGVTINYDAASPGNVWVVLVAAHHARWALRASGGQLWVLRRPCGRTAPHKQCMAASLCRELSDALICAAFAPPGPRPLPLSR